MPLNTLYLLWVLSGVLITTISVCTYMEHIPPLNLLYWSPPEYSFIIKIVLGIFISLSGGIMWYFKPNPSHLPAFICTTYILSHLLLTLYAVLVESSFTIGITDVLALALFFITYITHGLNRPENKIVFFVSTLLFSLLVVALVLLLSFYFPYSRWE